jgi:hypothetical protein
VLSLESSSHPPINPNMSVANSAVVFFILMSFFLLKREDTIFTVNNHSLFRQKWFFIATFALLYNFVSNGMLFDEYLSGLLPYCSFRLFYGGI